MDASQGIRREEAGPEVHYYFTHPELGELSILLAPAAICVRRKTDIILKYKYINAINRLSPDPVSALRARFAATKPSEIHRLEGNFSFMSALSEALGDMDVVREITSDSAGNLARKHGYLLPTSKQAKILRTTTYFGQLAFRVEIAGRTYTVVQFPGSSRPRDDDTVRPFVIRKKKVRRVQRRRNPRPWSEEQVVVLLYGKCNSSCLGIRRVRGRNTRRIHRVIRGTRVAGHRTGIRRNRDAANKNGRSLR